MIQILDDMFNGEIAVYEDVIPKTHEYKTALEETGRLKNKLLKHLSSSDKAKLEEFETQYLILLSETSKEFFKVGFSFANQINSNSDAIYKKYFSNE